MPNNLCVGNMNLILEMAFKRVGELSGFQCAAARAQTR